MLNVKKFSLNYILSIFLFSNVQKNKLTFLKKDESSQKSKWRQMSVWIKKI